MVRNSRSPRWRGRRRGWRRRRRSSSERLDLHSTPSPSGEGGGIEGSVGVWEEEAEEEEVLEEEEECVTWKAGSMDPESTTTMGDSEPVTTISPGVSESRQQTADTKPRDERLEALFTFPYHEGRGDDHTEGQHLW